MKPLNVQTRLIGYLHRLASLNYAFAFRMTLALALAWWLSYRFQLDKPYWSIMTVAVVAYPNQGALVAKFIARLIGTLLGALVVNLLANLALSSPWLFSIYLSMWLALCSYIASYYSDNTSYCFALSGYTAAIIGFALSAAPNAYTLFYITQARLSEIILGLVCALLVAFIFPAKQDASMFKQAVKENQHALFNLFFLLLNPNLSDSDVRQQYERVINKLMSFRLLTLHDYLSPATQRDPSLTYYKHSYKQMEAISALLTLHSMKKTLIQAKQCDIPQLNRYLMNLQLWLEKIDREQRITQSRPTPAKVLLANPPSRYFIASVNKAINQMLTIDFNININAYNALSNYSVPTSLYRDKTEALINAARTLVSVMTGVVFWLSSQWDMGYMLVLLIAVACTLGATYPMLGKMMLLTSTAVLLVIPVSYVVVFALLIKNSALLPAMLVMLPIFFVTFLLKTRSQIAFMFWHLFTMVMILLINFDNPLYYNVARFINISAAALFSLFIVTIIFSIISPTSHTRKLQRLKKSILARFLLDMQGIDAEKKKNFESYVFSSIYLARFTPTSPAKINFMVSCFLCLTSMQIVMQIRQTGLSHFQLPDDFYQAVKAQNINACLTHIDSLAEQSSSEVQGLLWQLTCAFQSIKPYSPSS